MSVCCYCNKLFRCLASHYPPHLHNWSNLVDFPMYLSQYSAVVPILFQSREYREPWSLYEVMKSYFMAGATLINQFCSLVLALKYNFFLINIFRIEFSHWKKISAIFSRSNDYYCFKIQQMMWMSCLTLGGVVFSIACGYSKHLLFQKHYSIL